MNIGTLLLKALGMGWGMGVEDTWPGKEKNTHMKYAFTVTFLWSKGCSLTFIPSPSRVFHRNGPEQMWLHHWAQLTGPTLNVRVTLPGTLLTFSLLILVACRNTA